MEAKATGAVNGCKDSPDRELHRYLMLIAVITFCISAFSLPMIMDRNTDLVTAIVTSINAVLRNRKVMLLWDASGSGADRCVCKYLNS